MYPHGVDRMEDVSVWCWDQDSCERRVVGRAMTHRCGLTKQVQKACPRMKRHDKISFASSLIALYLILILFLPCKVEILYYFIGNMIDLLR